ncbi:50S ribosomal protein L22 [Candidatus Deianiraea vastatrix]|uniref:Large ribosomal subunit protein uL22 n=1 Tax=Candidatus Deianiraea vastatrix TaxID=2163644 RepID=A0A5B8XD12_9RICK|nr:50S ribosomal protein L22 [Candidatus Deianiraea vastatrix]QED23193.1 50S ribosomal protein L22 [Candidatus Deianiraea vastatrix]
MKNNKNNVNSASATLSSIRGSVLKINSICDLIRGKSIDEAFLLLRFSKKRSSNSILECLKSAVANAENNLGMEISSLFVSKVFVGKAQILKRFMARGRGRSSGYRKFYSKVSIVVSNFNN